ITATAVAMVIGLRFSGAPPRSRRYGAAMLGGVIAQAVIGYAQYFSHEPAGLVWGHVAGSVLLWVCALKLALATPERMPAPTRPAAGQRAVPSSVPSGPAVSEPSPS